MSYLIVAASAADAAAQMDTVFNTTDQHFYSIVALLVLVFACMFILCMLRHVNSHCRRGRTSVEIEVG